MTFLQQKKAYFSTTTQKHYFSGPFFEIFLFHFFSYCPFYLFQHEKDKSTFFFENPFFDTLTNCQKMIFAPLHTICVFLDQQKHYKNWEKQAKKILDGFSTQPWTDFQLKNPQILDGFFNSTAYIYIYIYICMLWCYYLGQVWPFEVLLSGLSLFFFTKHCFVPKHCKNRCFSTFVFEKQIARTNLRCYYLGQVGHF